MIWEYFAHHQINSLLYKSSSTASWPDLNQVSPNIRKYLLLFHHVITGTYILPKKKDLLSQELTHLLNNIRNYLIFNTINYQ